MYRRYPFFWLASSKLEGTFFSRDCSHSSARCNRVVLTEPVTRLEVSCVQ